MRPPPPLPAKGLHCQPRAARSLEGDLHLRTKSGEELQAKQAVVPCFQHCSPNLTAEPGAPAQRRPQKPPSSLSGTKPCLKAAGPDGTFPAWPQANKELERLGEGWAVGRGSPRARPTPPPPKLEPHQAYNRHLGTRSGERAPGCSPQPRAGPGGSAGHPKARHGPRSQARTQEHLGAAVSLSGGCRRSWGGGGRAGAGRAGSQPFPPRRWC